MTIGADSPCGRVGRGRCHPCGRQERAHRDLENRTERGFPQRPHPSSLYQNKKCSLELSVNTTKFSTIGLLSMVCAVGVAAEKKPSAQSSSPAFEKIQVTDKFWAEGAAAGDLNRDGYNDVGAGPYWYAGPDSKRRYSFFRPTQSFKVTSKGGMERTIEGYEGALGQKNGYSETSLIYTRDFNQDGWLDVLVIGFPGKEATWYENPGRDLAANSAQWRAHIAYGVVTNESPGLVDLLGNGRPVILCMTDNYIGYAAPDGLNPSNKWTIHRVSGELPILRDLRARLGKAFGNKPFPFVHGLGVGDVKGVGRQVGV